jgi:glycosyltransferase involved in cell wall biosynthesis
MRGIPDWRMRRLNGASPSPLSSSDHARAELRSFARADAQASREARSSMTVGEIVHVDLERPTDGATAASEECLVIFWWADYPVGQAWDRGSVGRALDFAKLRDEAVLPDVLARAKSAVARERSGVGHAAPEVSLIICTRDRPEELRRCLASLAAQTKRPAEVIVIDNGSRDDRTQRFALAAGARCVREDRQGLGVARNTGARLAAREIVAYTDDDVELHPRWLERLSAAFGEPKLMAVTGLVLPAELATEAQRHFELYWGFGRGYRPIYFGADFFAADRIRGCPAWEIGAGANMAFRRAVFARIGYFDERLGAGAAGCSEDSEYWHRILSGGWTCRYDPSAVAFHVHRRELRGLARQIFYYMRGHAVALLVQYERSRNRGNLRRAFLDLPRWYARRALNSCLRGRLQRDRFLFQEVVGHLSGLLFYLGTPRPRQE